MIHIQILLIMLLLLISINFIGSRNKSRTKAIKKLLLLLTIPSAAFFIIFPSLSTKLANKLGVGRGADLLLYGLTIVFIFQLFDTYVRNKQEQARLISVTRRLAIMEAESKYARKSKEATRNKK